MSRQAMQQALEALEQFSEISDFTPAMAVHAITALRAALAEQDSVAAWENKYEMKEWQVHAIRAGWMPAPTPRKPLSNEQMFELAEIAWRHGWASCRDAEYVGEEAEDERWGMVGAEVVQDIAAHGIGEQT